MEIRDDIDVECLKIYIQVIVSQVSKKISKGVLDKKPGTQHKPSYNELRICVRQKVCRKTTTKH